MYPSASIILFCWCLLFLCAINVSTCETQNKQDTEPLSYIQLIITKYTKNEYLSSNEFKNLYESFHLKGFSGKDKETDPFFRAESQWCAIVLANSSSSEKGKSYEDVFTTYAVDSQLNSSSLLQALPALIIAHEIDYCHRHMVFHTQLEFQQMRKPKREMVWAYGIGFVVLVCIVSNLGGFLAPLTKSSIFQQLLMFLVSVAVGTLAATGLIVLIPEALDLMSMEPIMDTYIWKTSTVLGGIFFFYLSERLMKIGFTSQQLQKSKQLEENAIENNELEDMVSDPPYDAAGHSHFMNTKGTSNSVKGSKKEVRTVAWMMLLGDALHKFVDGLSIGAAYSQSIRTGLTLSIAILCEELPHELGDIAILLHSGMTMKMALLTNTLAAAVGLVGLSAGIFLGEVKSASQWIFAVAAGIFLYVPLVDMLPEMSHAADKAISGGNSALWITFIQMLGLCVGFTIILLVAVYAGNITI